MWYNILLPYKMIYWWGINIGDWCFYDEIGNIKSAILFQSEHAEWDVAQNRQYKIRQFLSTANLPNITPANKSSCMHGILPNRDCVDGTFVLPSINSTLPCALKCKATTMCGQAVVPMEHLKVHTIILIRYQWGKLSHA